MPRSAGQAEKLDPHPHELVALGFWNTKPFRAEPVHAPVRALHYRLERFLQDVKLSDLILPGRRIDVPWEAIVEKRKRTQRAAGIVKPAATETLVLTEA